METPRRMDTYCTFPINDMSVEVQQKLREYGNIFSHEDIDTLTAKELENVRGILTSGSWKGPKKELEKLPKLPQGESYYFATRSSGWNNLPNIYNALVESSQKQHQDQGKPGVVVSNVIGVTSPEIGDFFYTQFKNFIREGEQLRKDVKGGKLTQKTYGRSSRGMKVGIWGMGKNGTAFAQACAAKPVSMKVAYCNRNPVPNEQLNADGLGMATYYPTLEQLVSEVDVLFVGVPFDATTENRINADILGKAKKGLILINGARSQIVDHDAVADALDAKQLGGFITDVPPNEILSFDHRLRAPQYRHTVRDTAHQSGKYGGSDQERADESGNNLYEGYKNQRMPNEVHRENGEAPKVELIEAESVQSKVADEAEWLEKLGEGRATEDILKSPNLHFQLQELKYRPESEKVKNAIRDLCDIDSEARRNLDVIAGTGKKITFLHHEDPERYMKSYERSNTAGLDRFGLQNKEGNEGVHITYDKGEYQIVSSSALSSFDPKTVKAVNPKTGKTAIQTLVGRAIHEVAGHAATKTWTDRQHGEIPEPLRDDEMKKLEKFDSSVLTDGLGLNETDVDRAVREGGENVKKIRGGHIGGIKHFNTPLEGTIIGTAVTVYCPRADKNATSDNDAVKVAMSTAKKGCILVVSGHPECEGARMGGLMRDAARKNGCKGIVLDGNIRDAHALEHLINDPTKVENPIPVFMVPGKRNSSGEVHDWDVNGLGPAKNGRGHSNYRVSVGDPPKIIYPEDVLAIDRKGGITYFDHADLDAVVERTNVSLKKEQENTDNYELRTRNSAEKLALRKTKSEREMHGLLKSQSSASAAVSDERPPFTLTATDFELKRIENVPPTDIVLDRGLGR